VDDVGDMTALNRLRRRATGYLSTGQWTAARTVLETLLLKDPNDFMAKLEIAILALRQGHLREHARRLSDCARAFEDA
jgi:Tfp pilus assembly protein PilF